MKSLKIIKAKSTPLTQSQLNLVSKPKPIEVKRPDKMDEIDFWDRKVNNFTLQKFKSESIAHLPIIKQDPPKDKFIRVIPS